MIIGSIYEESLQIEFFYSPLLEMISSLHVIADASHHPGRSEWMEKLEVHLPASLLARIRQSAEFTQGWLIIMDFLMIDSMREYDIPQGLERLKHLSIEQWTAIFRENGSDISKAQKDQMIDIMENYYSCFFERESLFLQPFLQRIVKKEMEEWQEDGLKKRITQYHSRIHMEEDTIVFQKSTEHRVPISQLSSIRVTASTFMGPHLLYYNKNGILKLTRLITVERQKQTVPADLLRILKAFGDDTRLKIMKMLTTSPNTTQNLAVSLGVSEAGISKHLKILYEAGVVEKKRRGNYIYYHVRMENVDFIPYQIYEFLY